MLNRCYERSVDLIKRFFQILFIVGVTVVLFDILYSSVIKPIITQERLLPQDYLSVSAAFASNIRVGWNLGNSLDAVRWSDSLGDRTQQMMEQYWGNPLVTQALIQAVYDAGFNAIRIPVTWRHFTGSSPTYEISDELMSRVKQVVDYAIGLNMYVIINVHHDGHREGWLRAAPGVRRQGLARLEMIWRQIANAFIDYDERMIFEGMNEVVRRTGEWNTGTRQSRAIINEYNQRFVETVRATGGNNRYRFLIIKTYAGFAIPAVFDGFVIPDDDRLILSVHMYSTDAGSIAYNLQHLYKNFVKKGVPVFIGEWGTQDTDDIDRVAHAAMFTALAARYNITTFWWDNGGSHRLLNRETLEWDFPDIFEAIVGN